MCLLFFLPPPPPKKNVFPVSSSLFLRRLVVLKAFQLNVNQISLEFINSKQFSTLLVL